MWSRGTVSAAKQLMANRFRYAGMHLVAVRPLFAIAVGEVNAETYVAVHVGTVAVDDGGLGRRVQLIYRNRNVAFPVEVRHQRHGDTVIVPGRWRSRHTQHHDKSRLRVVGYRGQRLDSTRRLQDGTG